MSNEKSYTWAIPIVLFLLVQTGGLIWSLASITAAQRLMMDELASIRSYTARVGEEQSAEQLRQWSRINTAEDNLLQLRGALDLAQMSIENVDDDISSVKNQISELMALIRVVISERKTDATP